MVQALVTFPPLLAVKREPRTVVWRWSVAARACDGLAAGREGVKVV